METSQLVKEINALPESARAAIEQLIVLLGKQPAGKKMPPILREAVPLTEEEKQADLTEPSGWASRTDITDGAEYIHQVRRGLRQP